MRCHSQYEAKTINEIVIGWSALILFSMKAERITKATLNSFEYYLFPLDFVDDFSSRGCTLSNGRS